MQAHTQDSSLTVAKLGLAQIDLLKGESTNAITLLEGTLQEVSGWLDALKVLQLITCAFIEQACVYAFSVSGVLAHAVANLHGYWSCRAAFCITPTNVYTLH